MSSKIESQVLAISQAAEIQKTGMANDAARSMRADQAIEVATFLASSNPEIAKAAALILTTNLLVPLFKNNEAFTWTIMKPLLTALERLEGIYQFQVAEAVSMIRLISSVGEHEDEFRRRIQRVIDNGSEAAEVLEEALVWR